MSASKTVEVANISCGHCVKTIEREVGEVEGVTAVSADEGSKKVTVEWDDSRTDWRAIEDLMEEINYPPTG